jgi:hypothetical protein
MTTLDLVRMPIVPRAEIATLPVQGPVGSYVEVPVVLPSKKSKARGLGGMRFVMLNPDTLTLYTVAARPGL